MEEKNKTKDQLIDELVKIRKRVVALERLETEFRQGRGRFQGLDLKYRALLDHASDAILVADMKGNFLEANKKAEELLGYTREELLGMNPSLIHPQEELQRAIDNFAEAVAGRSHSLYDTKILRKDGQVVPVDMTGGVVEYRGEILVQGILRDITERKLMEKALFESEKRFRRLAENARDMVYRMSLPDGKYEYISLSSYDVVGFTPEEHYKGTTDIGKLIHPDFAEYFSKQWENLLKGEVPPYYEYKIIHRSGEERWLYQSNVLVCDDNGYPAAIEGIVTDVTDRKRMEGELRAHRDHLGKLVEERTNQIRQEVAGRQEKEAQYLSLIESIKEWVWETDTNFIHTYLSPRIYDVLGYKPEELIGRSPSDIMPPEEKDRALPLIRKVFSKKGPFASFQTVHTHKDGRLIFIEANGTPYFDKEGKLLGYRGSCHDVTEQKKAVDALRDREQQLESKSGTLEEVNAALRVLLKQRDEDRKDLEAAFVSNIREMVLPYIHRMQRGSLDPRHKAYLDIAAANLNEIISPILNAIRRLNLTPREMEVANHIKEGRTTREIAEIMAVAPSAIDSHRDNIRKKLGMNNQKINLRSYLLSLK